MAEQIETKILQCGCGQKMKVPTKAMGKKYKCVKCGEAILVSEQNTDGAVVAASKGEDVQPSPPGHRIGELLVDGGVLTPNQLQDALDCQRKEGGEDPRKPYGLGLSHGGTTPCVFLQATWDDIHRVEPPNY